MNTAIKWQDKFNIGSTMKTQHTELESALLESKNEVRRLRAINADLLEACKAALQCQLDVMDENTVDALESAIAKARGTP